MMTASCESLQIAALQTREQESSRLSETRRLRYLGTSGMMSVV
jgi:hypothetical protein